MNQGIFLIAKTARRGLLISASFLLFSCASQGPVKTAVETTSTQAPAEPAVALGSIESLIAQAGETNSKINWQDALLQVVQQTAIADCAKALQLQATLTQVDLNTGTKDSLDLLAADCLVKQGQFDAAMGHLQQLSPPARQQALVDELLYQIYLNTGDWYRASTSFYKSRPVNMATSEELWNKLQNLGNQELQQRLQVISPIAPFLQLLNMQRQYASSPSFGNQLQQWRTDNPGHPFATQWPSTIQQALDTPAINATQVGVLLPFSGRHRERGEAIKQGILSARFDDANQDIELRFFDSNQLNDILPEEFLELDVMVGPLLKENIAVVRQILPETLPMLSLNRSDQVLELPGEIFYFSLAPEDEALQLAEFLSSQGYQQPLLVSSQQSAYQRMANSFSDYWLSQLGSLPELVLFDGNAIIREEVAKKLNVTASKQQIAQISAMSRSQVHAFERNRRDIDVIVVFASVAQTELINPVIESSISPFADIVPVFASSRSFSRRLSDNSRRDLRNLNFIDMPWMLPDRSLNYLRNKADSLWPNRQDGEHRLFAMGYDAYRLLPHIRHMASLPMQEFRGVTGSIILNQQNQTVRLLDWAKITERGVQIGLD